MPDGFQQLEKVWEGFGTTGRVFDGEPRLAVAAEIEAAENGETHGEAVVAVGLNGLAAAGDELNATAGEIARLLDSSAASTRNAVERMRADFVANASHELRTPLTSLIGFIDTMLGPAAKDAAAKEKFLGIMRNQAGRMSKLIDDLL